MAASVLDRKLNTDVLWNLASVGVLGVSGILLNIILGRYYGAEALGVFNQVLALFIVAGQFGVFGFHYSASRHVADPGLSEDQKRTLSWNALVLTLAFSSVTCTLAALTVPVVGMFMNSRGVELGWLYAIPGVFFFSLNKLFLGVLNGRRRMRLYAFFQCLRYLGLLGFLGGIVVASVDVQYVPAIISLSEGLLFFGLVPVVYQYFVPSKWSLERSWLRVHWHFGLRSYLGGASVELNSKVDVLILGLFVSDRVVGFYSMATLFVEGLMQLAVAVRTNFNPIITELLAKGNYPAFADLVAKSKRKLVAFMCAVSVVCFVAYPFFIQWVVRDTAFLEGWWPLAILAGSFALCSGYFPFSMLLLQAGHPGSQTVYNALILLINAAFNFALIPFFGLYGSAVGTAISFAASVVILRRMAWSVAKVRL